MRINCVICVTGPARGALGPVRFLCTLLWGFGGLGPPWHRHWVLFPVLLAKPQQPTRLICVWGALGPVRFLCICFGSSGDLALPGIGTGFGSLWPWPNHKIDINICTWIPWRAAECVVLRGCVCGVHGGAVVVDLAKGVGPVPEGWRLV